MNFKEKQEQMKVKYAVALQALSIANDVDIGVALDMLTANIRRNADYPYVNVEEFIKDDDELNNIANNIINSESEIPVEG